MTFEKAREIVSNITYKPGWSISIHENYGYYQFPVLTIDAEVRDSYDPSKIVSIRGTKTLSHSLIYDLTKMSLLQLIRQFIHQTEIHESDEWIRLNGEMIFNPHKEFINV